MNNESSVAALAGDPTDFLTIEYIQRDGRREKAWICMKLQPSIYVLKFGSLC